MEFLVAYCMNLNARSLMRLRTPPELRALLGASSVLNLTREPEKTQLSAFVHTILLFPPLIQRFCQFSPGVMCPHNMCDLFT